MTHDASLQNKNSFDNADLTQQGKWRKALPSLILKIIAGIFLLLLTLAVALRLGVWQQASLLKPTIENLASEKLNARLRIKEIQTQWDGLKPTFQISNVELLDAQGQRLFSVSHVDGSISWRSLFKLKPRLSHLNIDNLEITGKRERDGSLYIVGQKIDPNSQEEILLPEWLLNARKITVTQTHFYWQDVEKEKIIKVSMPTLTLRKKALTVYAQAQIESALLSSPVQIKAQFSAGLFGHIGRWQDWTGDVSWSVPGLDVIPLQDFLPLPSMQAGMIHSQGLAYFQKGHIERADASFNIALKALQLDSSLPVVDLQKVRGSVSYHHTETPHTAPHQLDVHTLDWQYVDGTQERLQTLAFAWEMEATEKHPEELASPEKKTSSTLLSNTTYTVNPASTPFFDRFKQIDFQLAQFNLAILPRFLPSLPLPPEIHKNLLGVKPSGYIEDLKAKWAAPSTLAKNLRNQKNAHYSVSATLKNMGLSSTNKTYPSFTQLSGKLQASQEQGLFNVDSHQTSFALPGIFEEHIVLTRLQGKVLWQLPHPSNKETNWQVAVSDLQFENPDLQGSANGKYTHDKQLLSVEGKMTRFALPQIARYLPQQVGHNTLQFFKQAKLGGEARQVKINVRGPLSQFPYSDPKQGTFQIEIPVVQGSLQLPIHDSLDSRMVKDIAYWPAFEKIEGTVNLKQDALLLEFKQAKIFEVSLKNVAGKIPNLYAHVPRLQFAGEASGATADFLRFIGQSPLAQTLTILTPMRAEGKGKLNLKLDLALSGGLNDKIEGRYTLENNNVQVLPELPPLRAVSGDVHFTQNDFSLNNLRGRFAGGVFKAQGSTQGKQAIHIQGIATVNGLYQIFPPAAPTSTNPGARRKASTTISASATASAAPTIPSFLTTLKPYLTGSVKYQAFITLPQGLPDIRVQTDLGDLGLALPSPLGKARGHESRLMINWRKKEGHQEELSFQLDRLLQGRYLQTLDEHGQGHAHQGAIALNTPLIVPQRGVVASISLSKLNLDQWLELLDKFTVTPNEPSHQPAETKTTKEKDSTLAPNPYFPTRLRAQIDELILLNRKWEKLSINANSRTRSAPDPHWQVQLAGKQMQGEIQWTPPSSNIPFGAVRSHFKHLQIPAPLSAAAPTISAKPSSNQLEGLPALQIQAEHFEALGIAFGHVELDASNLIENNRSLWRLDKLTLQHPAVALTAKGSWAAPVDSEEKNAANKAAKQTSIIFNFDIKNGGEMLDALGMPQTLGQSHGKLDGQLMWNGNPTDIDYSSLSGKLELDLKDGVFLKADPGVAKLLGIFSFQIQNLQPGILGLRGLTSQGLPFDSVAASVQITKGVARTDDFVMQSSLATVKMHGSTSLKEKTQDVKVEVFPKVDLGSAALAYSLINPAIGLGSLLAQQILGKSIGQALVQNYTVTGSWANPVITKVVKQQAPAAPFSQQ